MTEMNATTGPLAHTGRSLRLTDEMADALVEAVRQGVPIKTAVVAAGISERSFYDWLQAAERGHWSNGTSVDERSREALLRFSQRIAQARAEHQAELIGRIQHAASTINPKSGTYDWRAADTLLSKHPAYRQEWREERHVQVDQQAEVRIEHRLVRDLDDAQLAALEQQLAALEG
jgi:hypothetical protein